MNTKTIAQPNTALIATRNSLRRDYVLHDEAGRRSASLRVGWTVRQGEIRTKYGGWPVCRHGWRQVTAGDRDVHRGYWVR